MLFRYLSILSLFLLSFSFVYSQNNYDSTYAGGTVVMAVQSHDAIIMGADSRSFHGGFNKNLQKYDIAFYVDGNRKIYQCGKYLIGFVGHQSFNNFYLIKLVDSFLTQKPTYTSPSNFLFKFIAFLKINFYSAFKDIIPNGDIICCGYYNNKPEISHFTNGNLYVSKVGYYTSMGGFPSTPKFKVDTSISSPKQYKFVKFAIDSFPYKGDDKIIIGGRSLFVKIDVNNKVTWPRDIDKFYSWHYTMDYLKALFTDKIRISIVDSEGAYIMLARLKKMYDGKIPLD